MYSIPTCVWVLINKALLLVFLISHQFHCCLLFWLVNGPYEVQTGKEPLLNLKKIISTVQLDFDWCPMTRANLSWGSAVQSIWLSLHSIYSMYLQSLTFLSSTRFIIWVFSFPHNFNSRLPSSIMQFNVHKPRKVSAADAINGSTPDLSAKGAPWRFPVTRMHVQRFAWMRLPGYMRCIKIRSFPRVKVVPSSTANELGAIQLSLDIIVKYERAPWRNSGVWTLNHGKQD